ncbi:CPBP family glutamic-type intramembrane protease [Furfurilactobacillus sp. WILCCON 0119]
MMNLMKNPIIKWLSALLLIPALVFLPDQLFPHWQVQSTNGLATWTAVAIAALIYVPLFLIAVFYWSDGILKQDWPHWRRHLWRNFLYAIGTSILMTLLIIPLSRYLSLYLNHDMNSGPQSIDFLSATLPTIIVFLIPLLQPFTEEIVYHHALIEPFSQHRILYIVVSIFSNLLFALVHFNNVSGNYSSLIFYFLAGIIFQIVYLMAHKNIWQNIATHLIYNGAVSLLGIINIVFISFSQH